MLLTDQIKCDELHSLGQEYLARSFKYVTAKDLIFCTFQNILLKMKIKKIKPKDNMFTWSLAQSLESSAGTFVLSSLTGTSVVSIG